jgi:hypothetical protein
MPPPRPLLLKEFDYNTTSAATEAAAGACLYSRCVVPPRCTYLLYSTSLRMPICRIHDPIPYVFTPPSHALEKGIRGGDPSAVRSAPCSCVSAQRSAVAPSRESSVLALVTTDIPVSPHTSNGEILAIVDSGTSKHILQCRTLLTNAKEAHVAVSSFAGDTSRSTYSGDLLCTVRTENGQLDLVSLYKGIHATFSPSSTVQTPVFGSYASCLRLLFTTGSILSTWLRTVSLKTQDSKITNVWVISPSSACVNSKLMVLLHQRRNA